MTLRAVRVAPNNPVFDLPVIVGVEDGLFADAGLDVSFVARFEAKSRPRLRVFPTVSAPTLFNPLFIFSP